MASATAGRAEPTPAQSSTNRRSSSRLPIHDTTANAQQLIGLPGAVSDSGIYGNINRATDTFWQAKLIANTPPVDPTRADPTAPAASCLRTEAEVLI